VKVWRGHLSFVERLSSGIGRHITGFKQNHVSPEFNKCERQRDSGGSSPDDADFSVQYRIALNSIGVTNHT
jgi:hypothetical protein